ncbi:DUF2470 domain-containing protein [Streptomyces cavernicola]|uniref:DUF2470 domain-containing protein n=1 Tax=Streptomyces cavernicola TaxID=3043613 RepID=A0ABT6S2W8_9ACTN|nr:DUF2470 domain-containing protein [Streptomyces sp. B-S-A6]MDI3402432.1 DUF2470 domain-containing protein [Streptomyces sp. B-S-A6]
MSPSADHDPADLRNSQNPHDPRSPHSPHDLPELPEQSAAERVRSLLAQAVSLSLTTDGQEYDLIGMHSVDAKGRITLHPQGDTPLAAQIAGAPRGSLAALLEFTDIAPTALRDRVRARVTLSGWLAAAEDGTLRLDLARVTLRTATGSHEVGLDEYALAEADPLAVEEAAMLTHLADAHGDMVVDLLLRSGSRLPHGVQRTLPLAVDRHGITLRCEYREGHCDLRLLFPTTATDAVAAGEQVRRLLTQPAPSPRCGHRPQRGSSLRG